MSQRLNKPVTLSACIAASIFSHLASLAIVQAFPYSTEKQTESPSSVLNSCMAKSSSEILKDSFLKCEANYYNPPHDSAPEKPTVRAEPLPSVETIAAVDLLHSSNIGCQPKILEEPLTQQIPFAEYVQKPLSLFELRPAPFLDHLLPAPEMPEIKSMPDQHVITKKKRPSPSVEIGFTHQTDSFRSIDTSTVPKIDLPEPLFQPFSCQTHLQCIALVAPSPFSVLKFPSLQDLGASSYSHAFETEIVFSPLEDGEGYGFAITLVPQPELNLPKLSQQFTFLIDRSNSIQKDRLHAVKCAVLQALESLDLADTFNVIAFDSQIEKLSPAPLPASSFALKSSKEFLHRIELGSFFSTTNLTKPLLMTLPREDSDDIVHTAILLTDGEVLAKRSIQQELAFQWTRQNNGRVCLFSIGLAGDPHLATLDAAAALNRGKILFPPSKRGIKRKLLKLMKNIRHPIAKDVCLTAIARSPNARITLFNGEKSAPNLYLDQPYVILGRTETLEKFDLFLQGRMKNQSINIRKTISFSDAKRADPSLKKELALQQTYNLYENFLSEWNPAYIAEANALLQTHHLEPAFK